MKATGEAGKDGEDGKNGLTPHIGENGNWWVGDTDTGVSAKGDKGDTGPQGPAGEIPEDYPQIREDVSQLKEDLGDIESKFEIETVAFVNKCSIIRNNTLNNFIGSQITGIKQYFDFGKNATLTKIKLNIKASNDDTVVLEIATLDGNVIATAEKAVTTEYTDVVFDLENIVIKEPVSVFVYTKGTNLLSYGTYGTPYDNPSFSYTFPDGTKKISFKIGTVIKNHVTSNNTQCLVLFFDYTSKIIKNISDSIAQNIDTTLLESGKAADAKVVGDKLSKLEEDTAVLQKRQNVLVGSETGNPAICNDAFAAPLCGLTVYGKSTQDGTPTPDAPVPIVSAGDSGNVAVKVTGKNRMPPNLRKGGLIECFAKKNTQVTVAFKGDIVSQGGNILFIGENNEQMWMGIDKGSAEKSIALKANATKFQYLLEDMASENVCLTWNASSPDYEPYREQLLTLPTPNGLPGIPVPSGGNYTDQNGQQWVCDEVDLERGVKVQRVNVVDLSTCTITGSTNLVATKRLAIRLQLKGKDYTVKAICNRLPYLVSFTSDTIHFYVDTSNVQVFIPVDAKNPEEGEYILFYVLDAPIETPLTPAEIAAYKAITAYAPDTVVQASDGAGIKLDYQRDVNLVVKNLEDAIASMTTTT